MSATTGNEFTSLPVRIRTVCPPRIDGPYRFVTANISVLATYQGRRSDAVGQSVSSKTSVLQKQEHPLCSLLRLVGDLGIRWLAKPEEHFVEDAGL